MAFEKGNKLNPKLKNRKSSNPPPPIELKQGRPSSYAPEFDETVKRLRLLMLTKVEIATFFGVAPNTLDLWGQRHPSFRQAYAEGGEEADFGVVLALRHRAMGYSHKAEKIMIVDKEIVREEYTEHYPPDTAAASLWLSNRQRGKWKLKQDDASQDTSVQIKITGGLPDE